MSLIERLKEISDTRLHLQDIKSLIYQVKREGFIPKRFRKKIFTYWDRKNYITYLEFERERVTIKLRDTLNGLKTIEKKPVLTIVGGGYKL